MIGIDIGFGYTKIFTGEANSPILFPSVFTPYRDRISTINSSVKGNINNMVLEYEGTKYLVGDIAKNEGGTSTFDRNNNLRHILCTLAGITLSNKGNYSGSVVMGLPISDYKTKKREIEGLKGNYEINFCTKKTNIEMSEIIVIPQGAAGFYDLIYSDNGKPIQGCPDINKYVGIIDIGEKTLDFVVINKGQFIMENSGSLDLGMNTAYRRLQSTIQDKLGYSIFPHQVTENLHRVERDAESAFSQLANEIIDGISRWWNYNQFDKIYIAGGGGAALHKFVEERIKCNLIGDSQFSNARGYYKLGMARANSK